MEQSNPPSQPLPEVDPTHRAAIVDRPYAVALDPIRLDDLLEVWERGVAPLRAAAQPLHDQEIEAHLARASVFLDRIELTRPDGGYRSILQDIARTAAFVCDSAAAILGFNRPAAIAFGLREPARLTDLPFDAEDIDLLRAAIARVAAGHEEKVATLRIRNPGRDSPVIVRVGPLADTGGQALALVVSTELVWPEDFATTVQEAFGLTLAEVEIVRAITLGQPVKEIAETRGRSAETVRTQVRSILAKTETHSQSELVRVVLGLMDVALLPAEAPRLARPAFPPPGAQAGGQAGGPAGALEPVATLLFRGPGGRRLSWIEFGAPQGAPCLVLHTDYGLIRWPAPAERAARRLGLRVIVPIRAGYGASEEFPPGTDALASATADHLALVDHLRLVRVAVLAMGSALRYGLDLARTRPGLVGGILGAACQMPLQTAAQFERMDKWQRFTHANARHAPKILPFVVKAGFSLARRMGKEAYFAQVNGGSPADMATFADPEVRAALLAGSEILLGADIRADTAFSRECIGAAQDWSGLLAGAAVPVRLLQGDQDPMTPARTVAELLPRFPTLRAEVLPNTGQLLFFAAWPQVLSELERFLQKA